MRRLLLATLLLSGELLAGTAEADEVETCAGSADPWSRLAACTTVIDSGDWQGARSGWAFSNRAMAHAELGNHLDAFDDHNKAIELDPANPRAWNNRATSHARFREYDRAFRDYAKALELDPAYVNALINRASLAMETGDAARARADYAQAMQIEEAAGRTTAGLAFLKADADCALGDHEISAQGRRPAFDAELFTRAEMAQTLVQTGYLASASREDPAEFEQALLRWTKAGCVWN